MKENSTPRKLTEVKGTTNDVKTALHRLAQVRVSQELSQNIGCFS